jgi:hypothetical protein
MSIGLQMQIQAGKEYNLDVALVGLAAIVVLTLILN